MAKARAERTRWVSYLRVSTVEQAEKELSLTAQRRSAEEFAARHEAVIDHHYVEPGASGTDTHRAVFNELLGDALRPGSAIATIVVHHTSRFTRDATHARVVKKELRRAGVRVLSVTQELADDPMGTLMEGFFECIDQYESEVNGLRTAAAMREAVRQGFYPGGLTPYGFCKVPVEVQAGRKPRYKLAVEPREAEILRTMYRLYVTGSGALKVAEALNALGFRTRKGNLWDKGAVIQTLQQSAAGGVVRWGVHHRGTLQPPDKWITLPVEPIIDAKTYALVRALSKQRRPTELPGRASKPRLLTGLARCGLCGSSYQLETSGKSLDGATYSYCYYNCRKTLRAGKKACPGFRARVGDLDGAVLAAIADIACTPKRAGRLARRHHWPPTAEVIAAWRNLHPARPRHRPDLRAPADRPRRRASRARRDRAEGGRWEKGSRDAGGSGVKLLLESQKKNASFEGSRFLQLPWTCAPQQLLKQELDRGVCRWPGGLETRVGAPVGHHERGGVWSPGPRGTAPGMVQS